MNAARQSYQFRIDRLELGGGPFLCLLTALIFATSSIAGKLATAELDTVAIVFLRSILALCFLTAVAARQRFKYFTIALRDIPVVFAMGWFGIVGYVWLFMSSLHHTTVTNASIIGATTPVLTALAASLFLHERLDGRKYAGIALSCSGVLLLVSGGELGILLTLDFNIGDLMMFGAVGCSVTYAMIAKPLSARYSAMTLTLYMTIGAILTSSVLIGWTDVEVFPETSISSYAALVFMGIVSSGFSYLLYNHTLKIVGPTVMACSV